jgi:hypothetical protein
MVGRRADSSDARASSKDPVCVELAARLTKTGVSRNMMMHHLMISLHGHSHGLRAFGGRMEEETVIESSYIRIALPRCQM